MDTEHGDSPSYTYFATSPSAETVLNKQPPFNPTQVPPPSRTTSMTRPVRNEIHITIPIHANQGIVCPSCQIPYSEKPVRTIRTYFFSALLCLFLCWPCVCLPCLFKLGYKTIKVCPKCKEKL
ncbi:uncharacterized protein LOC108027125 [Drosophila biarmipes]|uniref:uncharacterized protein LOC108027125 n=1 Tax=Drosophila biarmipes TaxID=125945 RepID=UPI0007E7D80F|nr:uncharacterized protein LOC108027125 [Drosophila biarmipes]